jgi:hypothetical protein
MDHTGKIRISTIQLADSVVCREIDNGTCHRRRLGGLAETGYNKKQEMTVNSNN